ncbi:hypothetical protein SISSUDRAFT_973889, partial [Sistotremastrum suecicum HHB10207 ss-3]
DVIVAVSAEDMSDIVTGRRKYEFMLTNQPQSFVRVWYYVRSPVKSLKYWAEVGPARLRGDGRSPLIDDGLLAEEFNTSGAPIFNSAYRILSVWELTEPIAFAALRKRFSVSL